MDNGHYPVFSLQMKGALSGIGNSGQAHAKNMIKKEF